MHPRNCCLHEPHQSARCQHNVAIRRCRRAISIFQGSSLVHACHGFLVVWGPQSSFGKSQGCGCSNFDQLLVRVTAVGMQADSSRVSKDHLLTNRSESYTPTCYILNSPEHVPFVPLNPSTHSTPSSRFVSFSSPSQFIRQFDIQSPRQLTSKVS